MLFLDGHTPVITNVDDEDENDTPQSGGHEGTEDGYPDDSLTVFACPVHIGDSWQIEVYVNHKKVTTLRRPHRSRRKAESAAIKAQERIIRWATAMVKNLLLSDPNEDFTR